MSNVSHFHPFFQVKFSCHACDWVCLVQLLLVTHRCRSCCLSAGHTSDGSHRPDLCRCHRTCAGNPHFHSYRSLKQHIAIQILLFHASNMCDEILVRLQPRWLTSRPDAVRPSGHFNWCVFLHSCQQLEYARPALSNYAIYLQYIPK